MTTTTPMSKPTVAPFRPGDVYIYEPVDGRHCREGMAIVTPEGVLFDTYWMPSKGGHVLTVTEAEGAEFLFNIHDGWEALPRHLEYTWIDYAPEDRRVVTSQHELCQTLYVRTGATPDLSTKIANAEEKLAEAKAKAESALRAVMWAEEKLAALIEQQGGAS